MAFEDFGLAADAVLPMLRLPRLANLGALELSGAQFDFSLEDLLLAAPDTITSLQLSRVIFRGEQHASWEASWHSTRGWPPGTRAWGRLARLERLRLIDCRAIIQFQSDEDVRFPAHISMLTALSHLEMDCQNTRFGDEDSACIPASLKTLWLGRSLYAHDRRGVIRVTGSAPLERLKLSRVGGFDAWDVSGLELGALTSLELIADIKARQPVPAWLPRCTALRKLQLQTGGVRAAAAGALPPGALAGLGGLELLEVRQGKKLMVRLAGREALRPFTARGSTARFPA